MIARISSPFDDELAAAGCTGTACGANATLGAGVLLLLLVSARGSSGSTRGCGVGALCGGGCSSGRGAGSAGIGVGAGAGAAGIRASFFGSSLGSVGGDRERTIRGTRRRRGGRVVRVVAGALVVLWVVARLTTGAARCRVARQSVVAAERFGFSAPPSGRSWKRAQALMLATITVGPSGEINKITKKIQKKYKPHFSVFSKNT